MTSTERFYPLATLPFENVDWEEVTASDVKGETHDLVRHARKVMLEKSDTSIDGPWWVDRGWGISDIYTIVIAVIFLPPLFLFWPFLFACCLPPVWLNLMYISRFLPEGCDQVPRGTLEWKIHCGIQFFLSLPVQVLALGILLYSLAVINGFGFLYLVVAAIFRCRSPMQRLRHNLDVIAPYQNGPPLYYYFEDCVAAVAGSVYRQGLFEFTLAFATMFIVNPWMKYWVNGNVYLEELGERFLTQVGQPLDDMKTHDVDTVGVKSISRAKPFKENNAEIDKMIFAPHYPFPPEDRRFAIGMQFVTSITNFVHTTHFRTPEIDDEGPVAALSRSCLLPVYRVVLWRNNPYHVYTGYVEANHSTGWPTQPEKRTGFEHPMWLVNAHNKLAADRNTQFSLAKVDSFFDRFLPELNRYVRLNVLGKEAADAAYEKDPKMGYEAAKLDRYQSMAEF